MGMGQHLQVAAFSDRLQIGFGAGATQPLAGSQLKIPGTFLALAVEVVICGNADLPGPGDEGVANITPGPHVTHGQRAIGTVILIRPPLLALGPLEIGQHIGKRPAGVAQLPPLVIIPVLPPNV